MVFPVLCRMGFFFCMFAYLDSYRQAQWELKNEFLKYEVGSDILGEQGKGSYLKE